MPDRQTQSTVPAPRPKQSKAAPRQTGLRRPGLAVASLGALAAGVGAAIAGYWFRRRARRGSGEHAAPDLARETPRPDGSERAPVAFRPDPTAPVPPGERESLRPATGPAPTLVADRGTVRGAS